MKKMIKASDEYRPYEVEISFCGYIGSSELYAVDARNQEEAEQLALAEAKDELIVEEIIQVEDGLFEVRVNYATYIGIYETYEVYEDTADDAETAALEEASLDLCVENIALLDD